MKKISLVIGTRPNYIKAFPVYNSLKNKNKFILELIHTGQHYDPTVNNIFFDQLNMTPPDIQFTLKSKDECSQLSEIMILLHDHYVNSKPDLVIVFGDVTSSLAGALVANKMHIKLAHVESGLRSFDLTMPEENNRILIDTISNYLFVTEKSGLLNLQNENNKNLSFFVGNTMIDTLIQFSNSVHLNKLYDLNYLDNLDNFIMLTLHRQSNVDNHIELIKIINVLNKISAKYKIIFPIHHRTKLKIDECKIQLNNNIIISNPLGYLDFIKYVKKSKLIITDSGGIQEEASYLGMYCITLRENTERPCTLIKNGGSSILSSVTDLESNVQKYYGKYKKTNIELWDGFSSNRISDYLEKLL